jgi:hypothetical protein
LLCISTTVLPSACSALLCSDRQHSRNMRRPQPTATRGAACLHSCLACFMCLNCTQQTVLRYSLDLQRSAPGRYLNTAAGWLVLLRHHAIRRLRTALPEGGARPIFGHLRLSEPGPNASLLRLRAERPRCAGRD